MRSIPCSWASKARGRRSTTFHAALPFRQETSSHLVRRSGEQNVEIFEQHELVDLPPARTSFSDTVSIGLPRRPTVQVRSEARNHHPCPLCPSVRPRRPALALHDRARRGPCALPTLQTRPRAPHVHPLGILPHIPACLQEFFSLTLSLPLPLSQVLSAPSCAGPPPAKISRLGGVLTHWDPERAPGAEFCASLHGALGCVHACRACC
jgi:hypothetical protein